MPVLIGELEQITGSPSSVTQVMVRAHETRITGSALTTDELVQIPVDRQGRFEVSLRPGKAVLVLVHGGRVGGGGHFPLLVEEGLGTITSAIKLASDRFDDYELDELERAAADMLASLDKGLVAATRAEVAQEDAEKARDKAGEHRDDAEKAAGTAAEDAATSAVQKADEKLSGYVTATEGHAEDAGRSATSAGKDAGRAEAARQGAETIEQNLPDKVGQEINEQFPAELNEQLTTELDNQLPAELDERVPPKVAEALAADRAVADAAAAAVNPLAQGAVDAAADGIRYAKSESLPEGTDLNDLWRSSDAGIYRLIMSREYLNLPSDIPRTTYATLEVKSTGSSGGQYLTQVSNEKIWYRPMTNSFSTPRGWAAWRRIDGDPAALRALQDDMDTTFRRRTTLEEGSNLNSLNKISDNGVRVVGSHGNYTNLPSTWTPNIPGGLIVFSTGLGDTWQRIWQRFDNSSWTRQEVRPGSFTEWERDLYVDEDGITTAPAPPSGGPQTTWEQSGIITSLEEGQAYQRWLAARQPLVELEEIGESFQGRPIHSLTIGDRTKPALFIMCSQHGDEVAGRESALSWARLISEIRPSFLEHICVVIVPAVNVDKLNIRRLSASGTNLNSGWQSRATKEVQAVWSAIQSYDTRAVIDAHEGGNWTDCQLLGGIAPEIDPDVRAASDNLVQAAWDGLVADGYPVSLFPGSENVTNARNAIAVELGIPCLLVETPSSLSSPGWNGPGPDPRLYGPALKTRVGMYRTVFEYAAGHVAELVNPDYKYTPSVYYKLVDGT